MKASPAEQEDLLHVQALDTRLQQLQHRLDRLPQKAVIADLTARDDELRRQRTAVLDDLDGARTELSRIESDVEVVEARIARDTDRLAQSSSVKDVAGLESELTALRKRLTDLEDIELAVMERVEEAEATLRDLDDQRAHIADEIAEAKAARDEAAGEIGDEREDALRQRAEIVARISEPLLALYERRQAAGGGVGAALIQARTCNGCTITLTGVDLDNIRRAAPDDVVECPECDRILIRTNASGI